jgi:malonyl-CoA/methylmalonyl-CoA synthetase
MDSALLPPLAAPRDKEAIGFGRRVVTYRGLAGAAAHVADRIRRRPAARRLGAAGAVTCVAVVGALAGGVPIVPSDGRTSVEACASRTPVISRGAR